MVLALAFGACVLRREQSERRSRDGDAAAAAAGVSSGRASPRGGESAGGKWAPLLHVKPAPVRAAGPRGTS